MSKSQNTKKDAKKKPQSTKQEKKAAKREKKSLQSSTGFAMDLKVPKS